MDSAIAKNQSHTASMCWIISIVPGSLVSNLLALFGWRPTRLAKLPTSSLWRFVDERTGDLSLFEIKGCVEAGLARSEPVASQG
jgi:hypothetical protein